MFPEKEWDAVRGEEPGFGASAGMGALRVALLFGSAAVALALIVAPIASRHTAAQLAGFAGAAGTRVDRQTTGSIGYSGSYVVRRSVLQGSASSVCVIRDNGTRSGDC